ncbi:putative cytochrome P450 superfamily [Arabidopsis thaliana]|uniref:Cytochrome P450-related n=3 Tax=Arabidopsis TaxID=3701 RepID=Q9C8E2_ARATH|nr:cytochrome P450, family 96, subfamily A, polypeptide 14 pseudogene [Arabidopsis thaliana]KAG7650713.1 Cytochrome P450 superfamily [Arabidopsis thaliana x Arabidopsis arenosa]AAG51313.1 hypothetical protein [Arabidopsis thaliana]AAY78668.1 cytochrome P450-related [Arabidopsis thaliana]AEE34453.1 cytochrome P450, family 96, subfamily A, polypeptide 14 pseudogene [Arabidopsis thaliana]OAP15383.1 CYP96A14P [Arabidopsis thaliana]|eukprot:NP_176777.1 cytochrome P450, family 96, subfamily A, polypeptide 14 pseudogene [Arabidopsis thaliana]
MALIGLIEAFIAFVCFLIFYYFLIKKPYSYILIKISQSGLWNWPVLGMSPGALMRLPRIYDFSVDLLENSNLTFHFKGPWFAGIDILATADSVNINHIYYRGPELREIFGPFGDGIINSDSELWRNLKKATQVIFNHQKYQKFSTSTTRSKLKLGLVPLFNDHENLK